MKKLAHWYHQRTAIEKVGPLVFAVSASNVPAVNPESDLFSME